MEIQSVTFKQSQKQKEVDVEKIIQCQQESKTKTQKREKQRKSRVNRKNKMGSRNTSEYIINHNNLHLLNLCMETYVTGIDLK